MGVRDTYKKEPKHLINNITIDNEKKRIHKQIIIE